MDSSLHSASLTADDLTKPVVSVDTVKEEEEHHIHMPNPSLWPLVLSVAILVTVVGLLFLPGGAWLSAIAVPFVLVGILGWAVENPSAKPEAEYILSPTIGGALAKYQNGQDVLDRDGVWLGTIHARFDHYILVDRGGMAIKVYYVPPQMIESVVQNNVVRLKVREADLLIKGLDRVPADLYDEEPVHGFPRVNGVPLFAHDPLSPAETGHYNYGPNFPGINTDAAGSYRPEEVRPIPQKYVADRKSLYLNRKSLPTRSVSVES
ncbi:MAG TPA: hypothetical protein VL461_13715 [Dictyobacter sp.]|jgi:hypothetical protein|nr:hypothetical protein [Dictyobacter sp.]